MPEITNAMRMAERRGRIQAGDAEVFLDKLDRVALQPQPAMTKEQAKAALSLSRKHMLTIYDAVYLELAMRLRLKLATLDGDLISAALSEGVPLL